MEKKYHLVKYKGKGEQIVFEERSNIKNNFSSLSAGFETVYELRLHEKILDDNCKLCNGLISSNYVTEVRQQLIERNLCFNCNFWHDKLIKYESNDPRVFVIEGVMYYRSNDEIDRGQFRGHGGRGFKIQKLDDEDEIIVTNNLWCNGDVPEHFKDKIKDNAKFITND